MSGKVLGGLAAKFMRFVCLRTITLSKTCYIVVSQMWFSNNFQNLVSALNRQRRVVLAVIIVLCLLLYLWPNWLTFRRAPQTIDPLEVCLEQKLEAFRRAVEEYDAVISRSQALEEEQKPFLPYVGNGYIGTAVYGSNSLYIKHTKLLSVPVKYYPIVHLRVEGAYSKEANVIDFKSGLVQKIQCIAVSSGIATAISQTYAHRTRPSVLVQSIRIENPTNSPIIFDVEQVGASDWRGSTNKVKRGTARGKEVEYSLTSGIVPVPQEPSKAFPVTVASLKLPETISIGAKGVLKQNVLLTVNYTDLPLSVSQAKAQLPHVESATDGDMQTLLNVDSNMLRRDHVAVWQKLWLSGFSISVSLAPGSLNGDRINATMYYVISHQRAPLHEQSTPESSRASIQDRLHFPDRCYNGHHTLQNEKMWTSLDSEATIVDTVKTWVMTLEKQGCASMLKAGADGVLQAMMLSFGALGFQNDHIEFNTNPKDLHRDYYYRRINYGKDTHVNISVEVGDDNKAILFAALDRNDKPYYACDAGCLDAPVKLSKKREQFPVKLTEPLTAILYITADRQHMEELKHVIHVKEIAVAPAHEHHVIALHRHGHHWGGLPTMFWVSLSILIIIFHLFLFKLIINEYCTAGGLDRSSKYNL